MDGGGCVVWGAGWSVRSSSSIAIISDRSADFFQVPCPPPFADFVQVRCPPLLTDFVQVGLCQRTFSRSDFVQVCAIMASLSTDGLSTDPQPSQPAQPSQASQPTALMFLICNICRYRQLLALPSSSVHYRRFCGAEWPPAKCERCCSCVRCRIRHDTNNYLNATDSNFNSMAGDGGPPQYQ